MKLLLAVDSSAIRAAKFVVNLAGQRTTPSQGHLVACRPADAAVGHGQAGSSKVIAESTAPVTVVR